MIYPVLDLAVTLSTTAITGFQLPQNSASHHNSIDDLLGCNIVPLCFVFVKYLPIRGIYFVCGPGVDRH